MIRSLLQALKSSKFLVDAKRRGCFFFIPDKQFYEIEHMLHFGEKMDWDNPRTYAQKIKWLMLYDRKPEYKRLVDKYAVRKYVKEKAGKQYLVPLYGVWDKFEEIDFTKLPEKFVLKCTHDSGSARIMENKSYNYGELKSYFSERLKVDFFHYSGREWPYKGIKRRIIAEEYLFNRDGSPLQINKFFCFNGTPKFVQVEQGIKEFGTLCVEFYDLDYNVAKFQASKRPKVGESAECPYTYDEMLDVAKKLSVGIPFVRVDLYEVDRKVILSELTLYPAAGGLDFVPDKWNVKIGDMLELPEKRKRQ